MNKLRLLKVRLLRRASSALRALRLYGAAGWLGQRVPGFVCPECGRGVKYCNVERDHWFYCERCRLCYCIGSNLFSSWLDESPEVWHANREFLSPFREVKETADCAGV